MMKLSNTTKIIRQPVNSIIEQHVEEAAFCWLRREDSLWRPNVNLKQFQRIEQRLDAHLEGLRLAADVAWPYALKRMNQWKTADEVFAASYIAIQTCKEDQLNAIANMVHANKDTAVGLSAALQWTLQTSGKEKVMPAIQLFWQQQNSLKNAIIDTALQIPEINIDLILSTALNSTDSALRINALNAIGAHQFSDYMPFLFEGLNDPEPLCQLAASTSLAMLGKQEKQQETANLISLACASEQLKHLLIFATTCSEITFSDWLQKSTRKLSPRDFIWANAFRGDSKSLTRLLPLLNSSATAPLTAYAIQHITGIDLDILDDNSNKNHISLVDEDTEVNLPPQQKQLKHESEGLSTASPDLIEQWLLNNSYLFNNGNRFLNGIATNNNLLTLASTAPMPQHWHHALTNTLIHKTQDWKTFSKPLLTN